MLAFIQRLKRSEHGLTLVELLAVIVILAIVGAIAFLAIGNVIENSKKDAHIANALQVIDAVRITEASGTIDWTKDVYATSAATGGTIDTISPLIDPWDENNKQYQLNVTKENDTFVIEALNSNCDFQDKTKENLIESGRDICDET